MDINRKTTRNSSIPFSFNTDRSNTLDEVNISSMIGTSSALICTSVTHRNVKVSTTFERKYKNEERSFSGKPKWTKDYPERLDASVCFVDTRRSIPKHLNGRRKIFARECVTLYRNRILSPWCCNRRSRRKNVYRSDVLNALFSFGDWKEFFLLDEDLHARPSVVCVSGPVTTS